MKQKYIVPKCLVIRHIGTEILAASPSTPNIGIADGEYDDGVEVLSREHHFFPLWEDENVGSVNVWESEGIDNV